MIFKIIIIFLLIGLTISLASGLVFLFKDVGAAGSRRTLHSLGVRVTLAAALLITVALGFYTGNLGIGAPWDARKFAQPAQQQSDNEELGQTTAAGDQVTKPNDN